VSESEEEGIIYRLQLNVSSVNRLSNNCRKAFRIVSFSPAALWCDFVWGATVVDAAATVDFDHAVAFVTVVAGRGAVEAVTCPNRRSRDSSELFSLCFKLLRSVFLDR